MLLPLWRALVFPGVFTNMWERGRWAPEKLVCGGLVLCEQVGWGTQDCHDSSLSAFCTALVPKPNNMVPLGVILTSAAPV